LTSIAQKLNLRRLIDQADASFSPAKFLLLTGGASFAAAAICAATGRFIVFAPIAAIVMAALPFLWLILKRKKRLKAFARQLPEALELISRALRAGHSLAAGIHLVASEMRDPIGKEFTRSYEAQNLGIPLEDTLEEMTQRVPNLDLRFFVTAIVLQRQTGGDLAEILDKIGRLIRERFQIWGQIQALTGEGRLSGIVLLALPPVLFIAMWRINPDYLMVLFTDPLGNKMLAAAAVLMLIGALVIKKIINIQV
jgi:tight adherence protein B